jgi:hypothetical protein
LFGEDSSICGKTRTGRAAAGATLPAEKHITFVFSLEDL